MELDWHDKGGGSQESPNCGACKESVEHVVFECSSYDSQRLHFLEYLKRVLPPDAFKTFLCGSIFVKQDTCMLLNNECNAWYNRVDDIFNLG